MIGTMIQGHQSSGNSVAVGARTITTIPARRLPVFHFPSGVMASPSFNW